MYRITLYNGGIATIVHGSNEKVSGAKISREKSAIGSLTFDINALNVGFDLVFPFSTLVEVSRTDNGSTVFEGRVIKPVPSMSEDGLVQKTVVCEDVTGYLLDSIQPYLAERQWSGSGSKSGLQEYIEFLLSNHNERVEEYKRIYAGSIDLVTYETSDGVYKGVNREKTWDVLKSKLLDVFGGEMRVRRGSDGKLYLDYSGKLGTTRATKLKLGKNIRTSKREVDPSSVITRLYPYGAKLTRTETDEDGNETEVETEERLTIEPVNNGLPYIDTEDSIEVYGIIEGTNYWDDVTTPQILLTKARAWLGERNKLPVSTTITAYDLSLIGIDPDGFELYDWYPCENELIGLDDNLEIVKQTIDINDPVNSSFDLGETSELTSKKLASINSVSKEVQSFKSETSTAIKNVQNSVTTTLASLNVMEDKITSNVSSTVTTSVKTEVKSQIGDLDLKDGEDGVGVDSVVEQYYISASATALEGGAWLDHYPTGAAGYVWTRTVVTYTSGDAVELTPVCVTGPKGEQGEQGVQGEKGETGTGVSEVDVEYCLSDSDTDAPTNGWVSLLPTIPEGQFLWSRSVVTYTDGTTAHTTPYCLSKAMIESALLENTLALSIESSNGATFLGGNVETLLTAHVFMAKRELTEDEISDLGTIVWYKDGSRYATGSTLPISADYSESNKSTIVAQLEREV